MSTTAVKLPPEDSNLDTQLQRLRCCPLHQGGWRGRAAGGIRTHGGPRAWPRTSHSRLGLAIALTRPVWPLRHGEPAHPRRSHWIRTSDLLLIREALYRAELGTYNSGSEADPASYDASGTCAATAWVSETPSAPTSTVPRLVRWRWCRKWDGGCASQDRIAVPDDHVLCLIGLEVGRWLLAGVVGM